ncbi:hypothetical protein LIER_21360 [Lithospermum erythrorhizon]|uniref:Uncharacterized protein n=1 Tax=Lithospermum erythrorhizon TaxID=34254 RepID=A0AAV3QPZ4_LITER
MRQSTSNIINIYSSDEDLYFRGLGPHKKGRWTTTEMLDTVDDRVDVHVLEKVNNLNIFETIRLQKRVWDCENSANERLVQIKRSRSQTMGDDYFNQIRIQQQNCRTY